MMPEIKLWFEPFRWYSNLVDRAQLLDDQYKHAKSVAQHALTAVADAGEGR